MGGISNLSSKYGLTLDRAAEAELKKVLRIVVERHHQLAKRHPTSGREITKTNMAKMFEDALALTNVFDRVKNGKLLFHTLAQFTVSSMDGEEKRRSRRLAAKEAGKMVFLGNMPEEQTVPGPAVDSPVPVDTKTKLNSESPTFGIETPREYHTASPARNTVMEVEYELQLASTLTNSDIERLILLEKLTEARLRRLIAERDLAQQQVGGAVSPGEGAVSYRSPQFVDETE